MKRHRPPSAPDTVSVKDYLADLPVLTEYEVHKRLCDHIRLHHPDLIFSSDGSGVRLSIGNAKKLKPLKSSRAIPDIFVAEPRGGYHGLYIEAKRQNTRLWKRNGEPADEHIAEQAEMLRRLSLKGYKAVFGVGLHECKEIFDNYMKLPK